MSRLRASLQHINIKLYIALLVMGFCPTIYTTVRTFFLGQLPGEWAYSIAGQLSWVNLLYEIISEAIILPLYFFMARVVANKEEYTNRLKSGLIIAGGTYGIVSALVCIFAVPLLSFMAATPDIIDASAQYIRIESIANIFGILYSFCLVALVSVGRSKLVYILTAVRLFLCLMSDTFLVSSLKFSLNLGVNGIGFSNIIVNFILFITIIFILKKQGYNIFNGKTMDFSWAKCFAKIGGASGLESLVRNVAYMLMVSRMVNMVGEQGTYWVANNFIWGWLLLPVTQLGELIKQETSAGPKKIRENTPAYFAITGIICALWLVSIPLYKPFMEYILGYSDVNKLFELVIVLLGFYVLYAFQNIFDCTFYGMGKTNYMLFESIVTNTIYYGTFFVLYLTDTWVPTLLGIALMFGLGNAFDSVVSGFAYRHFWKKYVKNAESINSTM